MKLIATTLLSLIFAASACLSQNVEFKAGNFKDDKEGFKAAAENLKKGDAFLELGNEAVALVKSPNNNFHQALSNYYKAHKFNPNNAKLNMKIGNCLLYTTGKAKAMEYLTKANILNPM